MLKEHIDLSTEDFRVLNRCSYVGHIWQVIRHPSLKFSYKMTWKGTEYIFGPEDYTVYKLVSKNILFEWDTTATKNLQVNQEYHINDSITLKLCID